MTVATVACAAESCEIVAQSPSLKIGGKAYKIKITVPDEIGAGETASVRVILPRRVREVLVAQGKGRLTLRLPSPTPTATPAPSR